MNKIPLILSIIGLSLILFNKGIDIDEDKWCLEEMNISGDFKSAHFNDPNYFLTSENHYLLTSKDRENYVCFGYTYDDREIKKVLEKEDIDYLGSDNFNRRLVLIGVIVLVPSLIILVTQLIRRWKRKN